MTRLCVLDTLHDRLCVWMHSTDSICGPFGEAPNVSSSHQQGTVIVALRLCIISSHCHSQFCAHMPCDICRTSWKLKQVSKNKDDTFTLTYDTPDGQKQIRSRSVALTVPAYIAADLLQQDCAGAADKLRGFDYPPVAAISLAYPMTSIRDDRKDKAGEVPGQRLL